MNKKKNKYNKNDRLYGPNPGLIIYLIASLAIIVPLCILTLIFCPNFFISFIRIYRQNIQYVSKKIKEYFNS
jgi:hypothetical protein